jgi:Na+/H+-dicarboxylate symporter
MRVLLFLAITALAASVGIALGYLLNPGQLIAAGTAVCVLVTAAILWRCRQ